VCHKCRQSFVSQTVVIMRYMLYNIKKTVVLLCPSSPALWKGDVTDGALTPAVNASSGVLTDSAPPATSGSNASGDWQEASDDMDPMVEGRFYTSPWHYPYNTAFTPADQRNCQTSARAPNRSRSVAPLIKSNIKNKISCF
jgi:hypothetical protein